MLKLFCFWHMSTEFVFWLCCWVKKTTWTLILEHNDTNQVSSELLSLVLSSCFFCPGFDISVSSNFCLYQKYSGGEWYYVCRVTPSPSCKQVSLELLFTREIVPFENRRQLVLSNFFPQHQSQMFNLQTAATYTKMCSIHSRLSYCPLSFTDLGGKKIHFHLWTDRWVFSFIYHIHIIINAISVCSAHISRSLRWSRRTPSSWASLPGCGGPKWEPMTRESVLGTRLSGLESLSLPERLCWAWTLSGEHWKPFDTVFLLNCTG